MGDGIEEATRWVPEQIDDHDWEEAFTRHSPFRREDIVDVLHAVDGVNDGDSWVGIFRLKNGTFGYLTAWCDYTGWGCQDGGHGEVRERLDDLIRECCTEEDRQRLGLKLPEEVTS